MTKVAMMGLGAMGSRMAARLVAAGHRVAVWNRTHRHVPGATLAASPRAAAAEAVVVLAMLRDDSAAAQVWLDPDSGAMAGMAPGTLGIDCSTLSPGMMHRLHAAHAEFLDAPRRRLSPAGGGGATDLSGGR